MSSLVKIWPVHSQDVDQFWPMAAGHLQKAIDKTDGENSVETLYHSVKKKDHSLWLVSCDDYVIAAVLVRVCEYPTGLKVACIDYAGGSDFDLWKDFTDYISPFYLSIGCDKMEITGRLGWLRLHTDKGFKPRYYVLRKDLKCPKKVAGQPVQQ